MKRAAILLLTVCLIADMAMPLMPGAFRFNPDESIDGVHVRTARVVVVPTDRLPLPAAMLLDRETSRIQALARRVEGNRRSASGPWPIRHLHPEPSPQAPEDH